MVARLATSVRALAYAKQSMRTAVRSSMAADSEI